MKLLFSEYPAQYDKYQFPYQVWALESSKEERDALLDRGFLPTRLKVGLWYLARSSRVNVRDLHVSSENRRIIKNTSHFSLTLQPTADYTLDDERMSLIRAYIKHTIKSDFSDTSLKRIFSTHMSNYVFEWRDANKLVGISPFMVTEAGIFYWYGFHNKDLSKTGLGMRMMLEAVLWAKEHGKAYAYVGTVYSKSSLYKTNIHGLRFFNGVTWSDNEDELKYLIEKDTHRPEGEILKNTEYLDMFYDAKHIGDILKRI